MVQMVLGDCPAPAPTASPWPVLGKGPAPAPRAPQTYMQRILCDDADPQSSTAFSMALKSKFSLCELRQPKLFTCS